LAWTQSEERFRSSYVRVFHDFQISAPTFILVFLNGQTVTPQGLLTLEKPPGQERPNRRCVTPVKALFLVAEKPTKGSQTN
jgi:hypothetical protein